MPYDLEGAAPDSGGFWGEIAPCEHLVQIYGTDDVFLASLEGFVAAGLEAGESVIVIATGDHLMGLDERLRRRGIDVVEAADEDRLITLDAEAMLAEFMRNDWPDDDRFAYVVGGVIERGRRDGRKVRALRGDGGGALVARARRGDRPAGIPLEQVPRGRPLPVVLRLSARGIHPWSAANWGQTPFLCCNSHAQLDCYNKEKGSVPNAPHE